MRMSDYFSERSILITVLQTFWLFLSIILLCIFILLIFVPGLSAPIVLLAMSPNHGSSNQLGSMFFVLCVITAITVLHFLNSEKAIKLSIILSFLIIIIFAYNLFSTSASIPLHHYGLFFTVGLMIIFDAYIESNKFATPQIIKRKFPASPELSERISDHPYN
jgi:hypothetical protein